MQNFRPINAQRLHRLLWGAHIFVYFCFLGWLASSDAAPFNGSKATAMVWLGLLVLHTLWIGFGQSDNSSYAEKPKHHLELSDDGELVEIGSIEWDEGEKQKRAEHP